MFIFRQFMKKHYFVLAIMGLLDACSGNQRIVNCPPKTIVYKHPEKFYPDAIKTTNTTIKNALNIVNKISDSGSVMITQNAQAAKETLNQFGALNSEVIKSYFIYMNSHPCDVQASLKFSELIAKISNQNFLVQNISDHLNNASNTETKKILLDSLHNIPPVVNAGPDQTIYLGSKSTQLNGHVK